MKYLVESGADINCRDTKDQSVLDHAYKTCKPFATFLLFKYGGMIRSMIRVFLYLVLSKKTVEIFCGVQYVYRMYQK
jgi:hypothetical protein